MVSHLIVHTQVDMVPRTGQAPQGVQGSLHLLQVDVQALLVPPKLLQELSRLDIYPCPAQKGSIAVKLSIWLFQKWFSRELLQ
jgi:hypothetical protein